MQSGNSSCLVSGCVLYNSHRCNSKGRVQPCGNSTHAASTASHKHTHSNANITGMPTACSSMRNQHSHAKQAALLCRNAQRPSQPACQARFSQPGKHCKHYSSRRLHTWPPALWCTAQLESASTSKESQSLASLADSTGSPNQADSSQRWSACAAKSNQPFSMLKRIQQVAS